MGSGCKRETEREREVGGLGQCGQRKCDVALAGRKEKEEKEKHAGRKIGKWVRERRIRPKIEIRIF